MFQNILLEPEQEELLVKLVEASRNVPREQRQKFLYSDVWGNDDSRVAVRHDGFPSHTMRAFTGDIEDLADTGLLRLTMHPERADIRMFNISPLGYRFYENLKIKLGQPVERIQSTVREYLSSEQFQRDFPTAYRKWSEAEKHLWSADSERQLSTIGHLCREAMQEFAAGLIAIYKPPSTDSKIRDTIARIRAVLNHRAVSLGKKEKAFLDALLPYWGTVVDLVQRQEHGGQKEGEPLVWQDGRRVVFQTAVVMFEIAGALSRGGKK